MCSFGGLRMESLTHPDQNFRISAFCRVKASFGGTLVALHLLEASENAICGL